MGQCTMQAHHSGLFALLSNDEKNIWGQTLHTFGVNWVLNTEKNGVKNWSH